MKLDPYLRRALLILAVGVALIAVSIILA